jgi:dTDP-glucose 4,6-dehydratase
MKNILITGGAGFIGSRFIRHIYDATNYNITVLDKLTYAADSDRIPKNIKEDEKRFNLVVGDICDITSSDLPSLTYIVNFAAESHVDNSIQDGRPFVRSNIEGVFNLLEIAKEQPKQIFRKFVQVSTDEVYGDMEDLLGSPKATESFTLKPSSYYSASKAAAEMLVLAANRTFGLPYLITRSCNNFGPGQHAEKFLPTVFESMRNNRPIPVYGDGLQVREWIHTDDHVRIMTDLIHSSYTSETYNIGSGFSYTNLEVIEKISEVLDMPANIEYVSDRLGHDRKYALDCKKLTAYKGDRIFTPLEVFLQSESGN